MSKEQIEFSIRSLFFFLFGVIFTFLFILTSTYLDITKEQSIKQKTQIINFLKESIIVREKLYFEEFMTKNYTSLKARTTSFLKQLDIHDHELIVLDENNCMLGDFQECDFVSKFLKKNFSAKVLSFESLGKIYIIYPIVAWGERLGSVTIKINENQIFKSIGFLNQLLFYILPFLALMFITYTIYVFTERKIINPTIKKIIFAEKMATEKTLVRQFAHDIQSPIVALEAALENSSNFPSESKYFIISALDRITTISNNLLDQSKSTHTVSNKLNTVIDELIRDKRLQYSHHKLVFETYICPQVKDIEISGHDLYRSLSNLINNSIESCFEIGREPFIKLVTSLRGSYLYISLNDNGAGIQQDKLHLVLLGDFSTKSKGNGIGLSSAKKWAESLNGSFNILTSNTTGTTVDFILPVKSLKIGEA